MDYWRSAETFGGGLIYKYNKENHKTEEYLLDMHHEISAKYSFEYAENTSTQFEIKKQYQSKMAGKLLWQQQEPRREITYYNDGKIMSDIYFKYNSGKQQTERGGIMDGKKRCRPIINRMTVWETWLNKKSVDTNGIVLSVEKFIYTKFDNKGNWETRQSILRGKPHSVAFQKIEIK